MKKIIAVILLLTLTLTGCTQIKSMMGGEEVSEEWQILEDSSKDTKVVFYYTEDDSDLRNWLRDELSVGLMDNNSIELDFQYVDFDSIYNGLLADKLSERNYGTIDLLLLNNTEIAMLKQETLLFDDYVDKLPNYSKYINVNDYENIYGNGVEIGQVGVPFGKNQFIFVYDEDELESHPNNAEALKDFIINNKGRFTYPMDKTGEDFLVSVLYDLVGKEKIIEMTYDSEAYKSAIGTLKSYLAEITPYLWKQGMVYPEDVDALDKLFRDGDVFFTMSSDFNAGLKKTDDESYPRGGKSFTFENGTLGDVKHLCVPYNSTNKTGAMSVINYLSLPKVQQSKLNEKGFMNLPNFDYTRLTATEEAEFTKIMLKRADFLIMDLLSKRYPKLSEAKMALVRALMPKATMMEDGNETSTQ